MKALELEIRALGNSINEWIDWMNRKTTYELLDIINDQYKNLSSWQMKMLIEKVRDDVNELSYRH